MDVSHLSRFLLVLPFLLANCASPVNYVTPREWKSPSAVDSIVVSFRPALQGRRIFLDPGHGGDDRDNRGPEGDAIEADVNLRVGLSLRSFLAGAGATVLMSRDRDTTIALSERPLIALRDSAEIFISLHHNATVPGDPVTNYASVYYHAREGVPAYHPANHDLARYIQRDMSYAMRVAGPPFSPTFDGTLSDYDIYPNSGFAVLRDNPIPAVLIEASFHTHPAEERRLASEEFNRIEAWGIFLGVGKYFRAGIPTLALRSDSLVRIPRPPILIEAQPAAAIDRSSLRLFMDGIEVPARDSIPPGIVTMALERDLASGNHLISGWVRNRVGNSSWPFTQRMIAMLPAAKLRLALYPPSLPPSPLAATRLTIRAYDARGVPVADGSTVRVFTKGLDLDTVITTTGGSALVYVNALEGPGQINLSVQSGIATAQAQIPVKRSGLRYVSGLVTTDSLAPVAGALVTFENHSAEGRPYQDHPSEGRSSERTLSPVHRDTLDITPADGRYVAYAPLPDFFPLRASRAGYFSRTDVVQAVDPVTVHDFTLPPVADGMLFGTTYVLDARYGGTQTGDLTGTERSSDVNLAATRRIQELLTALGANAILMREGDQMIAETERARRSASLPRGTYLRIDASSPTLSFGCEIYPNPANTLTGTALLAGIAATTGLDTTAVIGSSDPFFRNVAMATVSLVIPSVATGYYGALKQQRVDDIAWGVVKGILDLQGYSPPLAAMFNVRSSSGAVLSAVPTMLDETLTRYTDINGNVDFLGLEKPGFVITTPLNPDALIVRQP